MTPHGPREEEGEVSGLLLTLRPRRASLKVPGPSFQLQHRLLNLCLSRLLPGKKKEGQVCAPLLMLQPPKGLF